MTKPSLPPVASRTRSRLEANLMEAYRASKRRNTAKAEEVERVAETRTDTPRSSTKSNASLCSEKESDRVQSLYEDFDSGSQQRKQDVQGPGVTHFTSSDDDDNDDESLSSSSGEDSDESDDLDYFEEYSDSDSEPEPKPEKNHKCSSGSEDDDNIVCLDDSESSDTKSKSKSKSKNPSEDLNDIVCLDDSKSSDTKSKSKSKSKNPSEDENDIVCLDDAKSSNTKSKSKSKWKNPSEDENDIVCLDDSKSSDSKTKSKSKSKNPSEDENDIVFLHDSKSSDTKSKFKSKSKNPSEDENDIVCLDDLQSSDTKSKSSGKTVEAVTSEKGNHLTNLADFILNNVDLDSSTPTVTVAVKGETKNETGNNFLPLKFTFGVKETIIPQSTDVDEEEKLWTEMQFCLASKEIGSTENPMVDIEYDADDSKVKHNGGFLCRDGDHELVLDEEIGLKCKFCSFLQLEIKYIVSPFMKRPSGHSEKQYFGKEDSMFNGLLYQCLDDDMPGSDSSADIEGTVWEIIPDIKSKLYPHQREGFEFIWNNIAGGIYRDKSKNSSDGIGGCIISHAPGTGKTLLTIFFLQTYLKEYPSCRPVILAPRSMLLTWEAEFEKWKVYIPIHNLNSKDFSGKEETNQIARYKKLKNDLPYADRDRARHLVKLYSWKSNGGVLVMGYDLFKKLAGQETKRKQNCKVIDKQISKILLDIPGIFVLDEGHIPRNAHTRLWQVLSRTKTERRIILSGTPFQNNCEELYNTLCLVRPSFYEGNPYMNRYKDNRRGPRKGNEAKRNWSSWTDSIGKDDDRLMEVRTVIKPFVHVYKGSILKTALPGLRHFLVVLRPTDLQQKLLERVYEILKLVEEAKNHLKTKRRKKMNSLDVDRYASLISVHPSLLKLMMKQISDQRDINEIVSSIVSMEELERMRLKFDEGVKTKFLMNLLKLSEALEEKVIVFSQYLGPLRLIMQQLKDQFNWKEGEAEEILFMHGNCELNQRQRSIDAFNDQNSKAKVLLASTRACCEGINLIGGSRVVLLDVTWNPSVEKQATSRAHRLGQKKPVYIYHLITSGTEALKYCLQAGKDRLSELLFPCSEKGDDRDKQVCNNVEDKVLEEMFENETLKSMFEKIINEPKRFGIDSSF